MTKSHRTLVHEFENGATTGKSNSMSITELDDGHTALLGYGHAVYAVRTPDGRIVRFDGWAFQAGRRNGGSMTTKSSHFAAMRTLGDVRVAYNKPRTDMERSMLRNADVVAESLAVSAPKRRDAVNATAQALAMADTADARADA